MANSIINLANITSQNFDTELVCFKNDIVSENVRFKLTSFSVSKKNLFLFSLQFFKYLKHKIRDNDIIHIQGLWLFPSITPYFLKKYKRPKVIFSPRGTMDNYALNISKIKKIIVYNLLFQKKALMSADYFHATSFKEFSEIRNLGFKQPVAIIPNPINKTEIYHLKKEKIITFVGRIHPIKGLDFLLKAWKDIDKEMDYSLKIYGIWEDLNYIKKLKKIIKSNNLQKVEINGPIYGEEKNKLYQRSAFTIFPSLTENFGNSIGESLMNGTPVIVSDKTPWKDVENINCGFICKTDRNSIKNILKEIDTLNVQEIKKMGERGRKFALKRFSSDIVERSFNNFYNWIHNSNDNPPDFIKI